MPHSWWNSFKQYIEDLAENFGSLVFLFLFLLILWAMGLGPRQDRDVDTGERIDLQSR